MKTRKPYKSRWFYALGPNQEMIIDNNQNKIARLYSLSQCVISACLRGERLSHKGWRFTLIENPCPFVPAEKKEKPVVGGGYTSGNCSCRLDIKPVLQKPIPTQKRESDAKHMEAATRAGIRHLMKGLYPQWEREKADGAIFTNP